jgi:hypothetical protein
LKASTSLRLVRRSGGVPFWMTLGIAKRSLAAVTSPARSSSAQPLITRTVAGSAPPGIVVLSPPEDPQPDSAAMPRTPRTAIARAVTRRSWQCEVAKLDHVALHGRLAHRAVRGATALDGTARVEDLEAVLLLVQRHMGVAEDDRVGVGEAASQALRRPLEGPAS